MGFSGFMFTKDFKLSLDLIGLYQSNDICPPSCVRKYSLQQKNNLEKNKFHLFLKQTDYSLVRLKDFEENWLSASIDGFHSTKSLANISH